MADTTTSRYAFTKPGNLDAAGAGLWGPKLNTDFDNIDSEIAFPRLPASSPVYNGGGTTTCDLSLGRLFIFTVAGSATTVAFSNVPAVGSSAFSTRIRILITNGGLFPPTWPASVTWLVGGAPFLKGNGVDEVELVTKDGGTTWYGRLANGTLNMPRNNVDAGTGANTTEVTLHTVTVPAGSMGANGVLDITVMYDITGGGGTKTLRLKFGGTTFNSVAFAAGDAHRGMMTCIIANKNNVAVQWTDGIREVPATGNLQTFGGTAGAINTAVAQDVIVTGLTPTGADEITVKSTIVRIYPSI